MALVDHVVITISADSVGVTKPGFGTPLIGSANAGFAERVRSYTALSGIAADFAVTSPEYLAASAIFSQNPKVQTVKIGRMANQPTQKYTLTPVAANSTDYVVTLAGEGVTTTTVTFTSDGTATIAEITAGLEPLVNAVVGKNFTAVDNTTDLEITADAAGNWFSVEVGDVSLIDTLQDHVDPGVAADLTAISAEDDDWYGFISLYNSEDYAIACGAAINALRKIYVVATNESAAITAVVSSGDLIDTIKTNAYERVAGFYHPSPLAFADAAWMGKLFALDPGAATWKFMTLSGVPVYTMTGTQRTNLTNKNGNGYENAAGVNITFDGKMGDGGFIDNRRSIDWLQVEMETDIFAALAGANKVPFTDDGVALIEGKMKGVLRRAVRRGVLSGDPAPTTEVPLVADVSAPNKAARTLPAMKFNGTLAGAVHVVNVTGVVSV